MTVTDKTAARKRAAASAPANPTFEPLPVNKPEIELLEDEIARLRKMAPRTVKKLQNTILTQFKGVNSEAAVTSLAARGIITIDGTRVNWLQPGEQVVATTSLAPEADGTTKGEKEDEGR